MPQNDLDELTGRARVCCACDRAERPEAEDPTGETELRPYGPNGELICYFCAMSPEHRAEATRQLNARLDAAESASLADGGTVAHILLTPDGPKPLKTGRS